MSCVVFLCVSLGSSKATICHPHFYEFGYLVRVVQKLGVAQVEKNYRFRYLTLKMSMAKPFSLYSAGQMFQMGIE